MLFGHTSKKDDFIKAVRSETLGHAYLFFGDPRIGKCTFALSLANFLENGTFSVSEKTLIDTRLFSPDDKGVFSVDRAREVKKFLFQHPLKSPRRIVVIDDSESLTEEAQASLLKIVEEPPSSGLIIFIASHEETFFRPLLSRLTRIYFSRLSSSDLKEALKSLYKVTEEEAETLSHQSFGSIGNAQALLFSKTESKEEDDFGTEIGKTILSLWRKGVSKNSNTLFQLLQKETLWKRFNLNSSLQKKSISYIIHKTHNT